VWRRGPASEEAERLRRFGSGFGGPDHEHLPRVGGEVHPVVGEGEVADDGVVKVLAAGVVDRYFSEDAYEQAAEPKELYVVPNAGHVDLYDRTDLIPFDKLEAFFTENLVRVAGVREELAASVA
jgi:hypothetical protein